MQTDATLLANNTQQCWELLALVGSVCMGLKGMLNDILVRKNPGAIPSVDDRGAGSRIYKGVSNEILVGKNPGATP